MRRPSASVASDLLLIAGLIVAGAAMLPIEPLATAALGVLTVTLIAWPLGLLVWLARRWARVGDLRFVLLVVALVVAATTSTLVAITVGR